VIGQGTWYIDSGDRATAVAALRPGHRSRHDAFDTAEMYGDAELVVAEAIAGPATTSFWSQKVLPSKRVARGTITHATAIETAEDRPARLLSVALARVGSARETVALRRLVRAGKIRSWGVSNFDTDDLDEMLEVAGKGSIAAISSLSLLDAPSSNACFRGASSTALRSCLFAVRHIIFRPGSKRARYCRQSAEAHRATPRRLRSAFSHGGRRCLRFQKQRRRTSRRKRRCWWG